jgi:hypothetical protein
LGCFLTLFTQIKFFRNTQPRPLKKTFVRVSEEVVAFIFISGSTTHRKTQSDLFLSKCIFEFKIRLLRTDEINDSLNPSLSQETDDHPSAQAFCDFYRTKRVLKSRRLNPLIVVNSDSLKYNLMAPYLLCCLPPRSIPLIFKWDIPVVLIRSQVSINAVKHNY